ncbi:acyl-phosphate glycerol 3-phosphate acyltransferase [Lysinibacillus sp. 2017]|uniref:acyl-phosphate glycerol 3-phosphate acyltransferase n=1 Tax=unclassified Lysinibacillus TaxID=2636778 RepID=UPI000D528A2F|nr:MULTISPECIES: acyl-phosphate glycerol 3-phosphate acyltransferase [unclassified Lysinibacillus]AWE07587.1 acyl-phosphate glycerol 3-phosphate acyltransferase [Lysinibacillus sp. 2017]TGN36750.1 acyl-phosphate glycerol 3-phosphate acyltransferase [Lysinibacillus sp. S2017]
MQQPTITPKLLRLLVVFPNVMSYILLIGVIIYIRSNLELLKATDNLTMWIVIAALLGPISIYTTFSIIKRIRAGVL